MNIFNLSAIDNIYLLALFRIALILIAAFIIKYIAVFVLSLKKRIYIKRVKNNNLDMRLLNRQKTIYILQKNCISWLIFIVAIMGVISSFGINASAVLTSTGIVAAGFAFGAQTLVKDILSGIFIVLEDQFSVNDTINIGKVSGESIEGKVISITLRTTQLQDNNNILWNIRNGEIIAVGNKSKTYS